MVEVLLEWMAVGVSMQESGLLDTGESLLHEWVCLD